jgi:hypothetical protein
VEPPTRKNRVIRKFCHLQATLKHNRSGAQKSQRMGFSVFLIFQAVDVDHFWRSRRCERDCSFSKKFEVFKLADLFVQKSGNLPNFNIMNLIL